MPETSTSPSSSGPQHIGPYRILSQLGEGGMGTVYLAEQMEPVRRRVALKVIRDDRQGEHFVARFEMERKALERMEHPNIARVLSAGVTAQNRPYFAMEYVQGLPVDTYCDKKRLTIEQRLRLFTQICAGVQHAHTNGIMHRDLKPGNILVAEIDDKPVPKIIDFGLARAIDMHGQRATLFEELRRVIGTLAYMSPEQAGLEPDGIDARTDVYSLGVLLYELLTGRLPFDPGELEKVGLLGGQQIIREREPQRPSTQLAEVSQATIATAELRREHPRALWRKVAGELDWIVLKALQKERTRRYVTVRDLGRDVENHLAHEPVEARPPSAGYLFKKWLRRHRVGVVAGTLAVGGLLTALIVALVGTAKLAGAARYALLVSDPQVRRELERDASEVLWPATGERIADMDRWLAQARELWSRRDEHRALLATLDAPGHDRALHARIGGHVEELAHFGESGGLLEQMERRRHDAATIAERTLHAPEVAALWAEADRRVQHNPLYASMKRLVPQVGLVPIGRDPVSTLEEFAVLQSGEVPRRLDEQRLRPRAEDAIVLVLIPGGTATIGASRTEGPNLDPQAETREGPVQSVRLDPYLLSKYEMTQAQWFRISGGETPSRFRPDAHYVEEQRKGKLPALPSMLHPVDSVSWHECVATLRRLGLVLPTEAQWEFAARAGSASAWYFAPSGADWAAFGKHANAADSFASRYATWKETKEALRLGVDDGYFFSAPVGSLGANAYGLHDVHGNVWEWCRDAFEDGNYEGHLRDGDGECKKGNDWASIVRGGSFRTEPSLTRVSYREISGREARWWCGLRPSRSYDERGGAR